MAAKKYTLMNQTKPVCDFLYDEETHQITKLLTIHHPAYASPAFLNAKGQIAKKELNQWWQNRAIPISRNQIESLKQQLDISSTLVLAEKNFGLSLSDRYWINDPKDPQQWEKINFFDNDFSDDLGMLTLGQNKQLDSFCLSSPNSTLGGDLEKKWTILDGTRVLLKSGSGFVRQEVYNEVVATALYERLLSPEEYVSYSLCQVEGQTYCMCPNLLQKNEELITAYDIIASKKQPNHQSDYQFLVDCFTNLGLQDTQTYLSKLFVCDAILGNFDRHYRNFGVIRDVKTLTFTRFAPIFDSGNSLWCMTPRLKTVSDYEYYAKPFGKRGMSSDAQLRLLSHFDWFDPDRLTGFSQQVREILSGNPNLTPQRIDQIVNGVKRQISMVTAHIAEQKRKGIFVSTNPEQITQEKEEEWER